MCVTEQFAAPDRTGKISRFAFDAYAVLEASQAQGMSSTSACQPQSSLWGCSSTESDHRVKDHSPAVPHRAQEEKVYRIAQECHTGQRSPTSLGRRFHRGKCRPCVDPWHIARLSSKLVGSVHKSRTASILAHTHRGHCGRWARLDDHPSVRVSVVFYLLGHF